MPSKRRAKRERFCLEALESRRLLATFVVNSEALTGPGLLTIQQAVADANATPGANTITFAPSLFQGSTPASCQIYQSQLELTNKTGLQSIVGPSATSLDLDASGTTRAIYIDAGVNVNFSNLTITDGAPTGGQTGSSSTDVFYGGAIYNAGSLSMYAVAVTDSRAGGSAVYHGFGGGIYSSGSLNLQNCLVSGNTAVGSKNSSGSAAGGAVYSAGPLTMTYTTIGGVVEGYGDGGGIFAADGATISNSILSGNTAGNGGGIYSAKSLVISNSTVTGSTDDAVLSDTLADGSGGALFSTGTLSATNSTFSGTAGGAYATAPGICAGGAIYIEASATLQGCTIDDSTVESPTNSSGNTGAAEGGGIFSLASMSLTGCTLGGCIAAANTLDQNTGTASLVAGGGIYSAGDLSISQCNFMSNIAVGAALSRTIAGAAAGGAIYATGITTISQSAMIDNSAIGGRGDGAAFGGAIWSSGALTISQSTLSDNAAVGGPNANGGSGQIGSGIGGAINSIGPLTLATSTISSNSGTVAGGIYASGATELLDSTLAGNTAQTAAGFDSFGASRVFDCTLSGNINSSSSRGAGVSVSGGSMLLDNSIVSGNPDAASAGGDIAGTINKASSHNLIGAGGLTNGVNGNIVGVTNPNLAPLGAYGGLTPTMVPLPGSRAIDAGSNSLIPANVTIDQRIQPRIYNKVVDIGADEYAPGATFLSLSGLVYDDLNNTGQLTSNDPGLLNWQIYVDVNNVGFYVVGDPMAMTDSSGDWSLRLSVTGAKPLVIREVRQDLWIRTQPAGAYPLGYYTINPATSTTTGLNFGNYEPAT